MIQCIQISTQSQPYWITRSSLRFFNLVSSNPTRSFSTMSVCSPSNGGECCNTVGVSLNFTAGPKNGKCTAVVDPLQVRYRIKEILTLCILETPKWVLLQTDFGLILYVSVNSYGHVETYSPFHAFSWTSLTKGLLSTSCTYLCL